MDHDQRFKTLLQVFFGDFLRLFFASWAERLDCDAAEWLDKEIFPDPPEGARRILDLVARVPSRQAIPGVASGQPESWIALIHVEIESPDRAAPLRPRMFEDYVLLRSKYGLPVLPIGLYLRVGLDGIGIDDYEEHFWEFRPIHFQYLYVGLPALNALEYVQGENILGVALSALMKIPPEKIAWLGAEALRKIKEVPLTDQQRFLLGDCVQAYLPLDENAQREFEGLLKSVPYAGVLPMNVTSYDKGLAEGLERGIEKGSRRLLQEQLEERFGQLPEVVLHRIQNMAGADLIKLGRAIVHAQSLRDLGLEI